MRFLLITYAAYLVLINLVAFVLYFVDKRKAIRGKYRIPERVLLSVSFLGGAYLGYASMYLFRHKTRHWYFHAVNVAGIVLHTAILFFLLINA